MFFRWLIWRIALPLLVIGTITCTMWGTRYEGVFGVLAWVGFVIHLAVTWTFSKTHALDTGSVLFLRCVFAAIAELSESHRREPALHVSLAIGFVLMYAICSYVGRIRVEGVAAATG
ncbi:MAG: hypothetical protein JNL58_00645 [Planctomyces sp.]|nr:hypothetical protein [Planctomyces sp.]